MMGHGGPPAALFAAAWVWATLLASPAAAQSEGAFMDAPSTTPVCRDGFDEVASTMVLVKCRRTVPLAEIDAATAEAENAECITSVFWNSGPDVATAAQPDGTTATVEYSCRHVDG